MMHGQKNIKLCFGCLHRPSSGRHRLPPLFFLWTGAYLMMADVDSQNT